MTLFLERNLAGDYNHQLELTVRAYTIMFRYCAVTSRPGGRRHELHGTQIGRGAIRAGERRRRKASRRNAPGGRHLRGARQCQGSHPKTPQSRRRPRPNHCRVSDMYVLDNANKTCPVCAFSLEASFRALCSLPRAREPRVIVLRKQPTGPLAQSFVLLDLIDLLSFVRRRTWVRG